MTCTGGAGVDRFVMNLTDIVFDADDSIHDLVHDFEAADRIRIDVSDGQIAAFKDDATNDTLAKKLAALNITVENRSNVEGNSRFDTLLKHHGDTVLVLVDYNDDLTAAHFDLV